MADTIYNSFKTELLKGTLDLANDTIKVALVTASYTPNQDTHEFFSNVTNEVSGTGYTAGGKALTGKAVTQNNTDNRGVFDANDVVWSTSDITARGAVIYKDTGTPATSPLVCYIDFTTDQQSVAGDFTIQWATEGIVNLN